MKITHTNPINQGWIDEYTVTYSAQNPTQCILVHDVEYWHQYKQNVFKSKKETLQQNGEYMTFGEDLIVDKLNQTNDSSYIVIHSNWWGLVFFGKEAVISYLKFLDTEKVYPQGTPFHTIIGMQSGQLIDIWTIDTDYVMTNF
jgi:hypothetical protein